MPWVKEAVGDICSVNIDNEDKRVVHIHYPGVFEDQYLRADVRLEIGPFSDWIPHSEFFIVPYAAEAFPAVFTSLRCRVVAIKAERTFWEKALILHKESFHAEDPPAPVRYSRHYYDMAMMIRSVAISGTSYTANSPWAQELAVFRQREWWAHRGSTYVFCRHLP
jgi:hypothetical protein